MNNSRVLCITQHHDEEIVTESGV